MKKETGMQCQAYHGTGIVCAGCEKCAPAAQVQAQPVAGDAILQTWPKHIWLQWNPDEREEYPGASEELTWCDSAVHASDVEYVRADLAATQPAAASIDTPEFRALTERLISGEVCPARLELIAHIHAWHAANKPADMVERQAYEGMKDERDRYRRLLEDKPAAASGEAVGFVSHEFDGVPCVYGNLTNKNLPEWTALYTHPAPAQQEGTAASEQPVLTDAQEVEIVAREVFMAMAHNAAVGTVWVPGGNSLKQDEARKHARIIIAALKGQK